MRIVLDTNVLIAAALRGGFAEDIVKMGATTNLVYLVTSEDILQELRGKLSSKFGWDEERIKYFIEKIRNLAEVVEVTEKVSVITRDPEDNKILECAVSGQADLIVSSDKDIIKLKNFRGTGIVHPKTLTWTFPEYFKKNKLD